VPRSVRAKGVDTKDARVAADRYTRTKGDVKDFCGKSPLMGNDSYETADIGGCTIPKD
jgi:hypothetical protein